MAIYKVKISHPADKGVNVVDTYVVEATSVVDAEAKVAQSAMFTDYTVESITKPHLSRVFTDGEGGFFRCKSSSVVPPEKLQPCYWLVRADTLEDAINRVKREYGTAYHKIELVQLTNIKGYIQ